MTEFCGGLQDGAGAYLSGGAVNEQEHVLLSNGIKNETEADGGGNIVTANDESGYSGVVGSVDAYAALRKVPFCRSVDLSSYWKKHANAMEAAIWTTVSSCQYDDLNKKERLYLAVSDALSGKRTIKAASAQHSIPFTTVQTYFHRARQAATNALLELDKRRDMELPKQIEIPVLLTTSKYNDDEGHGSSGEVVWNTDHKDDVKPNSSSSSSNIKRSGGKLNEVLLNLTAKMQQQRDAEHNSVCSSSTEKNASRFAVGSSSMKRKPKSIRRLVSAELVSAQMKDGEGTANEQISFMDGFDEATEDSDNSDIHYEDIDCSEESDESEENFDESVTNWHRSVAERSVEGSDVSAATKKRLVRAILYVWTGQMRAEEACVHYCLDEEYFEKYFEHYDELLRTLTRPLCSDLLLSMNALAKNDGDVNGIESDIGAINMQIEEVYRKSHYSAEQKVRLHEAILMVLRGERTVNGAANMMQLPASTLHPYVQKARLAIGDCSALLSKSMSSLNDSGGDSNRKAIQPEWSDIAQVNDCVKGFLDEIPFDENIKAKLQAAILMSVAVLC
ncbi:unnamed protein product [Anisakis simplex]|uniref:HTH psq-type domain-containing protein n=1 Tax=Anisakis simplex TaxID=6269 RepID=A0A0M3K1R3_ANISI|nr:unnamed protein product [Anisakis simplex]